MVCKRASLSNKVHFVRYTKGLNVFIFFAILSVNTSAIDNGLIRHC